MTFVELPVVPIYWHFPRTIKGYSNQTYSIGQDIHFSVYLECSQIVLGVIISVEVATH